MNMIPFLSHLDCQIFQAINSHHTPLWDMFFSIITNLGNGWVITPVLLVIAFVKVPRKRVWMFILVSAMGLIASGMINSQVKKMVNRPRPLSYFATHQNSSAHAPCTGYTVHVVGEPLSHNSFPSGHTNTAFCAATLLVVAFGGWFWLAVIPALLVGYSRMYMGVHFPLDVLVGGLLGVVVMVVTVFIYKWIIDKRKMDEAQTQ